ncbi:MAG: hypothetical protein HUJ76_07015, partial [Parasporobacterium sp.]|nr:hypothetical protein [Parasporobacterium sp.]
MLNEILKIILIVLGGAVGFAVILILMALFIPVQYKLWGRKDSDALTAGGRALWLLGILYFNAEYKDSRFRYTLRIFGIPLVSDRKKPENTEKKPENKTRTKRPVIHHISLSAEKITLSPEPSDRLKQEPEKTKDKENVREKKSTVRRTEKKKSKSGGKRFAGLKNRIKKLLKNADSIR